MAIRKILVAVDGSKPSLIASDHAIDLAKKLGAELIAIYVISPDVRYSYLEILYHQDSLELSKKFS